MGYVCVDQSGKQKKKWSEEIRLIQGAGKNHEVEITGRGTYFHAIIERHHFGNFICIPNHNIGCELSDYSDVFWNRERLFGQLKKVDAVTVACALPYLKEL